MVYKQNRRIEEGEVKVVKGGKDILNRFSPSHITQDIVSKYDLEVRRFENEGKCSMFREAGYIRDCTSGNLRKKWSHGYFVQTALNTNFALTMQPTTLRLF